MIKYHKEPCFLCILKGMKGDQYRDNSLSEHFNNMHDDLVDKVTGRISDYRVISEIQKAHYKIASELRKISNEFDNFKYQESLKIIGSNPNNDLIDMVVKIKNVRESIEILKKDKAHKKLCGENNE